MLPLSRHSFPSWRECFLNANVKWIHRTLSAWVTLRNRLQEKCGRNGCKMFGCTKEERKNRAYANIRCWSASFLNGKQAPATQHSRIRWDANARIMPLTVIRPVARPPKIYDLWNWAGKNGKKSMQRKWKLNVNRWKIGKVNAEMEWNVQKWIIIIK